MAYYLVNKKILIGKSKTEVLSMLGGPDNKGGQLEITKRLVYFLGPSKGIGPNMQWLEVHFDSTDIVVNCIFIEH